MASSSSSDSTPGKTKSDYLVVARRYRPQSFDQLVGQSQTAQALANAIRTNRIGHAYLFTGARGVGKTSTARIFAKALNCQAGPTPEPCNQCDICLGITAGGDVDVLEIDGASNRGIDEIRQLRANVNIRPGRSRFKIYIIDEVHMLTTPAFNALLKTLEEPPEHVKFIFCTTDPDKIPITVLSRCQRFDFAPLPSDAIVQRLRSIVASEAAQAEEEALQLLARRAGGSMRDSQSLLEQILSFSDKTISVADVHSLLGTAESGQLTALTRSLASRDAASALKTLDEAISEGVDVGQLAEQLVTYVRDIMAAAVGCDARLFLQAAPGDESQLRQWAQLFGLETLLAMLQILDQAVSRMRLSGHGRMLLEVALVRLCHLEKLDELSQLVAQLQDPPAASSDVASAGRGAASAAVSPPQKKNEGLTSPSSQASASPAPPEALDSAEAIWQQVLAEIEDMTKDYGSCYGSVATSAPNRLVVRFPAGYTLQKEGCERPERKARIEQLLSKITGRPMRVDFELTEDGKSPPRTPKRPTSLRQRMRESEKQPFVQEAMQLFDADVVRIEEPRPPQEGE